MNWRINVRCLTAFVLLAMTSNALCATWRFVNVLADNPRCELDMSFYPYIAVASSIHVVKKDTNCVHALVLSGPITLSDTENLAKLINFYRSNPDIRAPITIQLDSPGGSVSAALAIASEMRNPDSPMYQAGSFVGQHEQCLSSCVLILAAGFDRSVFGKVGIHRPRFLEGEFKEMGYETLQSAYIGLYEKISQFLAMANIHPSLIDAMWNVPSSDIRYLNREELLFFRLTGKDLVKQEEHTLRLIRVCGELGPSHERDFMAAVNARCTEMNGKIDGDCFYSILRDHPFGTCWWRMNGDTPLIE